MTVADLFDGQHGRVVLMNAEAGLESKLREIGFCEGDLIEVITRGPLGGQPLAVRLNRRIIAMRLDEAAALVVDVHHG
ncbi:MAG: ferrous iron transport protein A [Hyphomonadaceae bacterium]|nr:ferrous iron transport protein A [Hyphomonadaceae bacterium]